MLPAAAFDENGECTMVNELMNSFGETSELTIFDTNVVKDYFEF